MDVRIAPGTLSGTVEAIPSKSEAHRLLICCALSDRQAELTLPSSCDDTDATIDCLNALGAKITRNGDRLTVTPVKEVCGAPTLKCRESGSTLRFLLPVAAALYGEAHFTGCGRLPERPISVLAEAMQSHGVSFSGERLPFTTRGRLNGGEYALPGNISSQYITGLLLALPLTKQKSKITLTTALESSGYVDITLRALEGFGVHATRSCDGFEFDGEQCFTSPSKVSAGGDWSNAAFFLAAGALESFVSVTGLDLNSSQGDKAVLQLLEGLGASAQISNGLVCVKGGRLRGCEIDISETPDLLPVLAVVAASSEGETRFVNAQRLRLKESDRLKTTAAMINGLGGIAREKDDCLFVTGRELSGGTVNSFNDHRIVMAASLAALRCKNPVTILGAHAVNKSYPSFFDDYNKLGGDAHVLNVR